MDTIYKDIAARTDGNIYIGVVGPVRTGKSTLIKRIMEELVIPNIDDPFRKERAKDELPQSGSGKTIMTSEPKFIPEEAVEISPDGTTKMRIRMIDSVGYMVEGAVGAEEDGVPRMVATPWYDHEIPLTEAAELGTKKVMQEHCSIGLVVTTDGSITDLPRGAYVEAEERVVGELKQLGKPFVIVLNSAQPRAVETLALRDALEDKYNKGTLYLKRLVEQKNAEISSLTTRAMKAEAELAATGKAHDTHCREIHRKYRILSWGCIAVVIVALLMGWFIPPPWML